MEQNANQVEVISNQDSKYDIADKLGALIKKITSDRDVEKANELNTNLKRIVSKFPELHWTLYVARLIKKSTIQNFAEEEQEEIINFCDNFNFVDEDNITNKCAIDIDFNQLNQIDFFYNTSVQVWSNGNANAVSFIDCVSDIWDFEKSVEKNDDSLLLKYFENCMITTILVNLRNYARSKYNLDSNACAKIIWTILENNIELTNVEVLKSKYNVDDEGFVLAVNSVSFAIEKILGIQLIENFNSETDNSFNSFNGYSNDYIAISNELLGRDIFDE
ncbi:MAG: hypothetical protein RL092_849 [Bacteroidota bacterium]|jgi:hypothetical protein